MPTRFKGPKGIQWRGVVKQNGQVLTKLFGTGREAKQVAAEWERETKKRLMEQATLSTLPTALDWANRYCAFSKKEHARKTFQEKKAAFRMFFTDTKENDLRKITPALAMEYLQKQCVARSGNAANKDRKNLGPAWN